MTESSPPIPGQPSPREEAPSLRSVVGQLAHAVGSTLGPGDVAALRRLDPADPACPAFFKVAAAFLVPAGLLPAGGEARDEAERRWASVLSGLAIHEMHAPDRRLGQALAAAGFSELRFVRLLRAHDSGLRDEVRTTARFLASKAERADWTEMAQLVLSDGHDHAEAVRRRIARDFYANLNQP